MTRRTPPASDSEGETLAERGAKRASRQLSLRTRALAILGRREHTRAELARKLAAFAASPDEIEPLLDELARRKLLSDERYAEARVHTLAPRFGAARIERELRARGVADAIADRAVRGARANELARARAVWSKRFGAPPANALEKARQARFLAGRGFPFEIIRKVLGGHFEEE